MGAAAVIVIIIILLVIVGGGVGAYFLLKEDTPKTTASGSTTSGSGSTRSTSGTTTSTSGTTTSGSGTTSGSPPVQNGPGIPPTPPSDPCSSYTSTSKGISQACYNKIWKDVGCTNAGHVTGAAVSTWAKDQTYGDLVNDAKLWATWTDIPHREGCYGTDRTKWPNLGPWKNLKSGDNAYVPIRVGPLGVVECMSANSYDCYWKGTSSEVDALIANPPAEATQPLICIDDAIKNKDHWCYKGTKQIQPSSPKLPPAHIHYYMRNNYLHY